MTEVRGFSKTKDETAWLRKHGLPDKAIYQDGRGASEASVRQSGSLQLRDS